jgi:hypothetical protein
MVQQRTPPGAQPHLLLVDHVTLRLCENALKVSSSKPTQLNTDRQTALHTTYRARDTSEVRKRCVVELVLLH